MLPYSLRWGPGCRFVLKLPATPITTKANWSKERTLNPSLTNQILSVFGIRMERKSVSICFKLKRGSCISTCALRMRKISLQKISKCTERRRNEMECSAPGFPLLDFSPCLRAGCIPTIGSHEISQYPHPPFHLN